MTLAKSKKRHLCPSQLAAGGASALSTVSLFPLAATSLTMSSLAQMELGKVTASFFRRFDASLDPSVKPEDMQMFDTFSASPSGDKLPLWLTESED